MWVLGVLVLLLFTSGVCVFAGRQRMPTPAEIWDLPGTARTYTTVVGTLAGFSVTSSIFIANLSVARESANFEVVMALFLIAFLVFISSAMQFSTTPNLASPPGDHYRTIQGYSYLLANANFYLALCLSWLGLPLLLAAIRLNYLGDIFLWLVLFAILGGALRIASSGLNIFASVDFRASLAMPLICFAAAVFYYAGLAEVEERLLPSEHRPTLLAVLGFAVGAAGFSLQSAFVSALRKGSSAALVAAFGRLALLALAGASFTTISLLWLAVRSSLD